MHPSLINTVGIFAAQQNHNMNKDMKTKLILIVAFAATSAAMAASPVGVGLSLTQPHEGGPIIITRVISNSSAWKAGIKPGSQIVSIDGTNTAAITNLSDCVAMIRGLPNTQVALGIVDPMHRQTNTVVLQRCPISMAQIEQTKQ